MANQYLPLRLKAFTAVGLDTCNVVTRETSRNTTIGPAAARVLVWPEFSIVCDSLQWLMFEGNCIVLIIAGIRMLFLSRDRSRSSTSRSCMTMTQ